VAAGRLDNLNKSRACGANASKRGLRAKCVAAAVSPVMAHNRRVPTAPGKYKKIYARVENYYRGPKNKYSRRVVIIL